MRYKKVIVLLAPQSTTLSGGYLYNRYIAAEMPEDRFMYLQLPERTNRRQVGSETPPSAAQLASKLTTQLVGLGVPPEATLLLDSLYFSSPDWIESLHRQHRGALAMLVHYLPSHDPTLPPARAAELRRSESLCLRRCRHVITTSGYMKTEVERVLLRETSPENRPDVHVATPGLSFSGLRQSRLKDPVPCGACPSNDVFDSGRSDGLRLLTVANWTAAKNHRFLLPVLAEITDLPWSWWVFGQADEGGALVEEFRQTAESYSLTDRVHIGSWISPQEVQCCMQQADLFVYPSLFESYGMAVAEAIAAGLPIIANRTGGIPEVVGDTQAAILCNSHNAAEHCGQWRRTIRELLTDSRTRAWMSSSAYARGRLLSSWSDTAAVILASLEQNR